MGDLRPIALCNMLYKIVTKVIANRLKVVFPQVISENQSTFLPVRLISDNVMVSFEVLQYLKRMNQGKKGYMALKLDLSKAYDRIEWPFLRAMMEKMGFCDKWIQIVISCVQSPRFTIRYTGETFGIIVPTQGIRQGDPLSPYLFLLCVEGLSVIIHKFEHKGWIHGCRVANGAPTISHMLFADDSYLYCKATLDETNRILEMLNQFVGASGQRVNMEKSSVFFSENVIQSNKDLILSMLGMQEADASSKYLGLPSTLNRNKSAFFGYIKE